MSSTSSLKIKILFVCYANMIRSQMAEGFARRLGSTFLDVYSAGLNPMGVVSEEAIIVMAEKGIDIRGQRSKGLRDVDLEDMDYVVSMSGRPAASFCPSSYRGKLVDWDVEDPIGRPLEYYRSARDDIESKVSDFVKTIWTETSRKS